MRDRPGVTGDPAQQGVTVVEAEQLGDLGALLGDQPVDPAADAGAETLEERDEDEGQGPVVAAS